MANGDVVVKADKVRKWKKMGRVIWLAILALLVILIIAYLVLRVVYSDYSFMVTLKSSETFESGLAMFESLNDPTPKRKLIAKEPQFMTNIGEWQISQNVHNEKDGTHNGSNYIAYTYYIQNQGDQVISYWYRLIQDDVVNEADEIVRVRIYQTKNVESDNPEESVVTYAKENPQNGEPEKNTTKFRKDEDGAIIVEQRQLLYPDEVDKYTVVVWIDGPDPECINARIGGELRMHMEITEEHVEI